VSVYYLPWWVLLACMPASALAVYLALRDSAISRRALFALMAVLAPLVLLGAAVAALAVSVSLSVLDERLIDHQEPPARIERTQPTTTVDRQAPATTAPTASPTASSTASPSATASLSARAPR
jgi:cytoskeletal protein RodZ